MRDIKPAYETIIVGGGVTGVAIAHSLAVAGRRDTLLLERNFPAGGATAKAATLISQVRSDAAVIPYVKETVKHIGIFAEGDPESLGFCRVGAVHAASSSESVSSLEKTLQASRNRGVNGWEITPRQAKDLFPCNRSL
jgi:glycine/D-amino acid oxidase-like deaminating enzyme